MENEKEISTKKILNVSRDNPKAIYILITFVVIAIFTWWTISGIQNSFLTIEPVTVIMGTLFLGSIYLCISLGLNMTYKLINFANFAHAEYFITGAYVGILWNAYTQDREQVLLDYFIVVIFAFLIAGAVAVIGDLLVYEPLRNRNASAESLMISSIGWGIIIRNIASMFFSGEAIFFEMYKPDPIEIKSRFIGFSGGEGFFNISKTSYYLRFEIIVAIILTAVLVTSLFLFLEKTKVGTALRATSDNLDLAEASGIDTTLMTRITWMIGGGLAGVAGVIFVSRIPVIPYSGFLFLLPAFAVIVLGGVGSLKGSVVASIIIAFSQTLAIPYLVAIEKIWEKGISEGTIDAISRTGLSAYSVVVPFMILIGFMLFKPTGLYGEVDA